MKPGRVVSGKCYWRRHSEKVLARASFSASKPGAEGHTLAVQSHASRITRFASAEAFPSGSALSARGYLILK
jgi:hypothetical protein